MIEIFDPIKCERELSYIEFHALGENGVFQSVPSEIYESVSREALMLFGNKHGFYSFPTHELISLIQKEAGDAKMIEIGGGDGVYGRELRIPCTDSFNMEKPEVKAYYDLIGAPVTKYGSNVLKMDALEAVEQFKPDIVLASWVTHKSDPLKPHLQGHVDGVDWHKLMKKVEKVFFIGNHTVHTNSPLLTYRSWCFTKKIYSRASSQNSNFFNVFYGK